MLNACAVCTGTLSWWSSHVFFHTCNATSSLVLTASNVTARPCKCAGWRSGFVARIVCTMPFTSKEAINITLIWDLVILAFFGLSDVGVFYWKLWHLVSRSYSKIQTRRLWLLSPTGSVSSCSRMSWHTCTRRSYCSSFSNFRTIFAQIFLIPRSSVMILHTFLQFMSNSFAIILTVKWWSPCTFWQTNLTFSSVLLVLGLLLLGSSSTSSFHSLNLLCHSQARALDIVLSPYICSNLSASVGLFLSWTRNFKLVRWSVVIV